MNNNSPMATGIISFIFGLSSIVSMQSILEIVVSSISLLSGAITVILLLMNVYKAIKNKDIEKLQNIKKELDELTTKIKENKKDE